MKLGEMSILCQWLSRKLTILLVFCISVTCSSKDLTPFDFGLTEALSNIERYEVIFKTHQEALKLGVDVDYSGIDELHIEIPKGATPIPLSKRTDFKGLKLYVSNHSNNQYLFTRVQRPSPIDITKDEFVSGTYVSRPEMRKGTYLLVVEDMTPWVDKREGYTYGFLRKDVVLISGAKAKNTHVMPYLSAASNPRFSYLEVDNDGYVKNLEFYRTENSTYKTFLFQINWQNGFCVENVSIYTPDTKFHGDAAISVSNCTNTLLKDICIQGTYSQSNKFGYGISLDNVWNTKIVNICSNCKWGVFGNNNVNKCTLKNCKINRFDVHCYGRDIYMQDCCFSGMYNQFSSVFGTVSYKRCVFDNQRPCLIESSYNAYTGFNLNYEKCTFMMNKNKCELVFLMDVPQKINSRPELALKCLPNVRLKKCSFFFEEDLDEWFIFRAGNKKIETPVGYVSSIDISDAKMLREVKCHISNFNLTTMNEVEFQYKR